MNDNLKSINWKHKIESNLGVIIFFYLILIHLPWINFNGVTAGDTQGYVDVSINWFNSEVIYLRPIIYPIFIYLSKLIGTGTFGILIYIQVLFYAMSGVLFYNILVQQKIKLKKLYLALLVIISFSAPQTLGLNQVVLPEMFPLFFILLLFNFILKPSTLGNSIVVSILILTSILLKPLWLLLLAFPIIKLIYSEKSFNNILYGCIVPITLTISLYSTNQYLVAKKDVNKVTASTFDVNTNLALIRMGLINGSENTKLNSYLISKNLIQEINQRSWTNDKVEFSKFTQIKDQIPWEYREDSHFWKNVLLKNPNNLFEYFSFQLTRLPIFFSTSAENGRVKFLPNFLNSIYQRFYSNIHSKHITGILFLVFTFIIGLFSFKQLTINKLLFFLILGVGIVLCLLTYQNPHFVRMRGVIEPFIIYTTLYSLIKIIIFLKDKRHTKFKKHQTIN